MGLEDCIGFGEALPPFVTGALLEAMSLQCQWDVRHVSVLAAELPLAFGSQGRMEQTSCKSHVEARAW